MVLLAFSCFVGQQMARPSGEPVAARSENKAVDVLAWVAGALLASGVSGYVVTEIMLNWQRRAQARTSKDEMTPERHKRERLMAVQKVLQWAAISGAVLGAGVLAKKSYDQVLPARKAADEKKFRLAVDKVEQAAREAQEAAKRAAELEKAREMLDKPVDEIAFKAKNAQDQADFLKRLIELHKDKDPSISEQAAVVLTEYALVLVDKSTHDKLSRRFNIFFHPDKGGEQEIFKWFNYYLYKKCTLDEWKKATLVQRKAMFRPYSADGIVRV